VRYNIDISVSSSLLGGADGSLLEEAIEIFDAVLDGPPHAEIRKRVSPSAAPDAQCARPEPQILRGRGIVQ
jgi:hypothetical protein